MAKNFDFGKLQAFQGSVLKNLKVPTDYRSYSATCKKVVKLYLRLHQDQLFLPELVTAVKDIAAVLRFLGVSKFHDKAPQDLVDYLEEISTFNSARWVAFKHDLTLGQGTEVVVEEARERKEGTRCALCRVHLHFPAHIVHRNETEVLHKSNPIGVKCLRQQQGRLKTFLESEQIASVLREIKAAMVAV